MFEMDRMKCLSLKYTKKNALIDFLSVLPEIVTTACSNDNIKHRFIEGGELVFSGWLLLFNVNAQCLMNCHFCSTLQVSLTRTWIGIWCSIRFLLLAVRLPLLKNTGPSSIHLKISSRQWKKRGTSLKNILMSVALGRIRTSMERTHWIVVSSSHLIVSSSHRLVFLSTCRLVRSLSCRLLVSLSYEDTNNDDNTILRWGRLMMIVLYNGPVRLGWDQLGTVVWKTMARLGSAILRRQQRTMARLISAGISQARPYCTMARLGLAATLAHLLSRQKGGWRSVTSLARPFSKA